MKIFLIPGLGYDYQIFEKLNFKNHDVSHIEWIEPKIAEPIKAYAIRLFENLPQNEEKITLIGHSFGGVVAQEIAAVKKIDKIILIASVKSQNEIPLSFKLIKYLKLHRFLTKKLSIHTLKYWGKTHGFKTHEDQELFKSMIRKTSNHYLQWALKTLVGWTTPKLLSATKLIQIHGTRDKTFPLRRIQKPNIIVEKGSHIMLYKRPEEMNAILTGLLK